MTDGERRRAERLFQLGVQAASEKRNDEAAHYWEIAWATDPGHPHVAERLRREYLALGMEAWAEDRIQDAIAHWNAVLRVAPDDVRARGYIRRAYELDARLEEIVRESELAETDE